MACRTDDPILDHLRHEAEVESYLSKLPICSNCGEPIQDDVFYEIGGRYICPDCLEADYARNIEDYIGD